MKPLLLILIFFISLSIVFTSDAAPRGASAVAPAMRGVITTAGKTARTIVSGVRRLFSRRRGARLDPQFEDKSSVVGSIEHVAKLEAIIDELTKENAILRQQRFIYKKNVQYHKDIATRLRREKESMRVAMETIKKETTAELTQQFLKEKEQLMKELTAEFDHKSKAMKMELKDAKVELKTMSKELQSALASSKGIDSIKAELREVTSKLSESEALVKHLQANLKEKDKLMLEKGNAKTAFSKTKDQREPAGTSPNAFREARLKGESKVADKTAIQAKSKGNMGEDSLKASSSGSRSVSGSGGPKARSGGVPRPKTKIASSKRTAK